MKLSIGSLGFIVWIVAFLSLELRSEPQKEISPLFLQESLSLRDGLEPDVIEECKSKIHLSLGSTNSRTVLYSHGFSACPMDLEPIPSNIARQGLAHWVSLRLRGHGRSGTEGLRDADAMTWLSELRETHQKIHTQGMKTVLMGTSTGGTLSTWLAVEEAQRGSNSIEALILVSPNFGLPQWESRLLLLPFGIGAILARLFIGEYREWKPINSRQQKYWTTRYPSSALIPMMEVVSRTKSSPLESLKLPVLLLYCDNDNVVDSKEILKIFDRFSSPKKRKWQAPCNEDPHVLAGEILSPKSSPEVEREILQFLKAL